jgi:structural maintenance of chromosome 4
LSDERLADAFYFALRDTLVCETLEVAQYTAFNLNQRHRVVTTEGALIEISGTMTGGGKPRSGGMSSKFIEEYSEVEMDNLTTVVSGKKMEY